MTAHITFLRACAGYVIATAAASASVTVSFGISYGIVHWRDWGLLASVVWCAVFIAALIPYPLAVRYANREGERGWGFFSCAGLATALLGLVLAALAAPKSECGDSDGPALAHFLELSLHFAAAGIIGGTACWLVLKSAHDEDTVPVI